jgi:integrase
MARRKLTDRFLKSLRPAPEGKRYDVMDIEAPGLGVRVTDKGHLSFIFAGRFPGTKHYTRREIDHVLTLAEAREAARQWRAVIRTGVDPVQARRREREQALRSQAVTFKSVAEAWITEKLSTERNGEEVERSFRKDVLSSWVNRPITEITELDVLTVIRAKKQTAPAAARNLLANLRRFFNWAIDQRCYGLAVSPCDRLKPTKIIGKKPKGQRILSDDELFALWRAARREPYPFSAVYPILMLTAVRLNEAAHARKSEVNFANRLWTIPAERMKGTDDEARPHAVPLVDDIAAVFKSLPQFTQGPYVFTTTFGRKPVSIGDLVKKRLDRRMLLTLRALARRRGEDPAAVELPRWTNHDIRRTVRSNLSRLKVAEEVREALLAHVRPGIKGTYDLYDYLDEKRGALELWAARLRSIVNPPTDTSNVITLAARG